MYHIILIIYNPDLNEFLTWCPASKFNDTYQLSSRTLALLIKISRIPYCQRCYYQLRQIRRVRKSLFAASKLLLVLASAHSRLDYCNSVLHSLAWFRLQLLGSVLNSAVRPIRGLGWFDHITPILIDLLWLPYPQRISYKICLLMFKCLKDLAPAYLTDLCVGTALL